MNGGFGKDSAERGQNAREDNRREIAGKVVTLLRPRKSTRAVAQGNQKFSHTFRTGAGSKHLHPLRRQDFFRGGEQSFRRKKKYKNRHFGGGNLGEKETAVCGRVTF